MWKRLAHPNIVPLLGVTFTPFQSVSVWMPGGELSEYISTHPCADRLSLVGCHHTILDYELTIPQLSDVANGLSYLHSHSVIHGDLKGVCEVKNCLPNLLTRVLAKHPCGRYGPRTAHRLLPRWRRFRLRARCIRNQRSCSAVGRT